MNSTTDTEVFNNAERVVEGWYWAMRPAELKRGRTKALSFLGREMVVYRGEDNRVVGLDAYCPHMGALLGRFKVERVANQSKAFHRVKPCGARLIEKDRGVFGGDGLRVVGDPIKIWSEFARALCSSVNSPAEVALLYGARFSDASKLVV